MTSKSVGLLLTLALPSFARDKEETKRDAESSNKKKKRMNKKLHACPSVYVSVCFPFQSVIDDEKRSK